MRKENLNQQAGKACTAGGNKIGRCDYADLKQAQKALDESQHQLSAILDNIADGFFAVDRQWRFTHINDAALLHFQKTRAEVLGRNLFEVFPAARNTIFEDRYRHAMENGEPVHFESNSLLGDMAMEVHAYPGRETMTVLFRDVTERKHAEEALRKLNNELEERIAAQTSESMRTYEEVRKERQRFYDVLEMLPAYVVLLSPDYHVPFANRLFRERFGESHGRRCYEYLFQRTEPCVICETYTVLKTEKPHHWDWTGPDGRNYDVHDFPFTDSDGAPFILEMGIDITDMKRAESALKQANITLEQRVAERTAELEVTRNEAEMEKRRLQIFIEHAPAALAMFDREMRYLSVSHRWRSDYGLGQRKLIGVSHYDVFPEIPRKWREAQRRGLDGEVLRAEADRFERANGSVQWIHWEIHPWTDTAGKVGGIVIFSEDITDRKIREEQLNRLNRTLRALGNSSQAMMRATSEQAYMEEVCRIIVEDCGHAMSWIGIAGEDAEKSVRPVACGGVDDGYLRTVNVNWADTERGRGPTGTAIRTGKPSMCRNMLTDPAFIPWREEALKRGYASSLVLPLISGDKVFGALTTYFREPDPFTADEVHLLTELADDLAYGIMTIRLRSAHSEAEAALQESEERYRSLFENMTEGFALHEIICDEGGAPCDYRFLDINPMFEKLTGFNRKDVIGRTVTEILPGEDPQWIERYGEVALTGKPIHFDNYSRGLGRHFEVTAYRPAPLSFAVIFRDITKRKQMEVALSERTVQLENANKELESFSYSVSHDLRAPLRAIDGYSRMILRRQGEKFDSETLRQFNLIRENARTMGQLIDDLLSFSRLNRKEIINGSLDMESMVRSAWSDMTEINPDRDMRLVLNELPRGVGDQVLIKQVILNLLSNAIKFSRVRESAVVEVGAYPEEERNVYFIRDNGVGFDMQYYDKLFGVFQRLHSTEEFEGTGVGLAIVERIIHRHGGTVWAEGKVGEGATFYFTLTGE